MRGTVTVDLMTRGVQRSHRDGAHRIVAQPRVMEIVRPYEHNPVVSSVNLPGNGDHLISAGCIKHAGRYFMMLLLGNADEHRHFRTAGSDDGISFEIEEGAVVMADSPDRKSAGTPCSNPQITRLDGTFYITYAVCGDTGGRVCLVQTDDFCRFRRIGFISPPDSLGSVLFPEKIDGRYLRLDLLRMSQGCTGDTELWLSYSPDLIHWGDSYPVARTGPVPAVGRGLCAGSAPIRTGDGWLLLYHDTFEQHGLIRSGTGVMLLDLDDPRRVISRGRGCLPGMHSSGAADYPVLGAVVESDDNVRLYFGMGDAGAGMAFTRLSDLVGLAREG